MPNWSASMQQTFEFYTVDPGTWSDVKKLENVKSSTISWDADTDTLGSATFDVTESTGECYIRIYLITIQNGVREKFPLGTFLVQTPSTSFNGKIKNFTMDAYTPLLELKESSPPIGYSLPKGTNILDMATALTREHLRAPVVAADHTELLDSDFISDPSETWMSFLRDLLSNAKYEYALDEKGRVLFSPKRDTASLQPVWTFDDGNSSILYPEVTMDHDMYGIPNVVEVVYTSGKETYYARVVNDDENSPISTVNRGREIVYRDTNPSLVGDATRKQVNEYAKQLLRNLSTLEYTISFTHGYCPVKVGDCVRLDYTRSGFTDIKAKIISQNIKCKPGCSVTAKAVFTTKLWEG